ncbi:hypothetical protein TNCV_4754101 [Trichonephila clavipes]|nr:hypothetical protein TNCV_4754101 [Trichonephila clavipes]
MHASSSSINLTPLAAVGSLVVRASDSRPEGLVSLQKLWRWRQVVSPSIVPSGNFAELNRTVTCMVLKANDRRTSSPMPR